ncbi:MAG TPA: hypothetical protein VIM61_13670 [Chthoniobacterales bacterium]
MTRGNGTSFFARGVMPGGMTVACTVTGAGQLRTHSPMAVTAATATSPAATLRGRRRTAPPVRRSQAGGRH